MLVACVLTMLGDEEADKHGGTKLSSKYFPKATGMEHVSHADHQGGRMGL